MTLAGRPLKLTAEQHVSDIPALADSLIAVLKHHVTIDYWPTRLSLN
jgi:hypothetical protein